MSLDVDAGTLGRLRRLARENKQMGPRLAQLEYREMRRELENPELFDLSIDFDFESGPDTPRFRPILNDPVGQRLPALNVPLGRIAWLEEPHRLPVIGIYLGDSDPERIRVPFADLMNAHHARPFARLVFLCQGFRMVPFLGRFGFAIEHVGQQSIDAFAPRVHKRFDLIQIRDLASSKLLWQPDSTAIDGD